MFHLPAQQTCKTLIRVKHMLHTSALSLQRALYLFAYLELSDTFFLFCFVNFRK